MNCCADMAADKMRASVANLSAGCMWSKVLERRRLLVLTLVGSAAVLVLFIRVSAETAGCFITVDQTPDTPLPQQAGFGHHSYACNAACITSVRLGGENAELA